MNRCWRRSSVLSDWRIVAQILFGGVEAQCVIRQLLDDQIALSGPVQRYDDVGLAPRQRKAAGKRHQLHQKIGMPGGKLRQSSAPGNNCPVRPGAPTRTVPRMASILPDRPDLNCRNSDSTFSAAASIASPAAVKVQPLT